jgi:hypothetical protein
LVKILLRLESPTRGPGGGAHSMERSKTCVFVIQAAALAIAWGIFDLEKRYFPPHKILRKFPREVPKLLC